ncbi:ABC transporter permease [Microseira wollei]|uniref:ABC transporter permease n=1 Tax=Microseira wollei NIES-4236 TaxID=2530354 RepID=A0AAV3WEW8_9CYAN|nr:ABC transporter permease [Microseira wollei]GET36039.1 hypothetical protein MiSe_07870 [Microseira wollei NIES-4236]
MKFNWIDRIGDWNPQLLRELKGRLKPRNVIIAVVASLVGQVLLFLSFLNQLNDIYVYQTYCRLGPTYDLKYILQQRDQINKQINSLNNNYEKNKKVLDELYRQASEISKTLHKQCPEDAVNMQLWWQDYAPKLFLLISVIAIFALLVAGTFMLINDLSQEERRGTLNFIRFSPRSSGSILVGKILGVPILVYLAVILTIPLHLWLGIMGQIPIGEIFSFYGVLIAGCGFFYSAALLCSFVTAWLIGFQSWLISGAVLCFLWITSCTKPIYQNPTAWISLFNPSFILRYLVDGTGSEYWSETLLRSVTINELQWFYLPLGASGGFIILGSLLNYTLWTYWIWQGLNRCFRNRNATILSKGQSYWLVFYFGIVTLGFALEEAQQYYGVWYSHISTNFVFLPLFYVVLLFSLIAMLSPQRQDLQDWARYRHQRVSRKGFWNWSLWQDLILGEKSPAQVAIFTNMLILASLWLPWMLLLPKEDIPTSEQVLKDIFPMAFFFSIMMIYASIAQLLLMRNDKRSLYATATIIAAICLPPTILLFLGINPSENPIPWLLSTFPWVGIEAASLTNVFLTFLGELSVLALINLRLTRQLQQAGESATKALLAGRN